MLFKRFWDKKATKVLRKSNIKDFWESNHKYKIHRWLTGSSLTQVKENLNISDLIDNRKLVILEVGVGLGYCTKDLAKKHKVDALDISLKALKNVEKYCQQTYSASEKMQSNKYDLIIVHLVIQHMSDKSLKTLMIDLIRTLKPKGLLAIQNIVRFDNNTYTDLDVNLEKEKAGNMVRSLTYMTKVVTGSGGIVKSSAYTNISIAENVQNLIFHVTK
jgi:2-polyprenyl-3-methyl-5-hydroxy-6-metoxy-1,4-benzoquinol methylase